MQEKIKEISALPSLDSATQSPANQKEKTDTNSIADAISNESSYSAAEYIFQKAGDVVDVAVDSACDAGGAVLEALGSL